MIQDRAAQIDRRLVLHQVRVDGVTSSEHAARHEHHVAHLEGPDLLFGDRRPEWNLATGSRESSRDDFRRQHRLRGRRAFAIEPLSYPAARRVDAYAEPAERPTVIRHRYEEARGQPVECADLAADERCLSTESHGANRELVGLLHDTRFNRREPRIRIRIVERAKQLFLCMEVSRRAVAAGTHTNGPGAAALSLGFPYRVEDAFANAVERAIGAAEMVELGGQRVLRVGVLAAAALEDQFDFDVGRFPLIEVDDRRSRPEVVA